MTIRTSPKILIELDDGQKYLTDHPEFDFFPSGAIDKSDTNIGATHAELISNRNSILVFPSRSIAFNKYLQNKNQYFYVGSTFNGVPIINHSIQKYHRNTKIKYKKFLVVANSLKKLMQAIGNDVAYNQYFFFFDEIDKFQSESTFRSELEECVDYFLDHRCKGCIISASIGKFSNPKLKRLPISVIKRRNQKKEVLNLYRISVDKELVLKFIYKQVEKYPREKFLIAHKSTQRILYFANHLDIDIRKDVKILCGDNSRNQVNDYYGYLINDRLPSRINFMTAAYFSGVDIKEKYHLIIISDTSTKFTLLTLSEIRQVAGRCREGQHHSINLIVPNRKIQISTIKKNELTTPAKKIAKQFNITEQTASILNVDIESLKDHSLAANAVTKQGVQLVRRGLDGNYKPSTFTIDQYLNRQSELKKLYTENGRAKNELSKYFDIKYPRKDLVTFSFEERIKQSYYNEAVANKNSIPEAKNEIEKKITARLKLCLDEHFTNDLSWIIKSKYWNSVSFRKEYITQYVSFIHFFDHSWRKVQHKFKSGCFVNRKEMKKALSDIINDLKPYIEINSNDYLAVMEGFLKTKITTKNRVSGFKILEFKRSKRTGEREFSIFGKGEKIKFNGT